MNDTRINPEEVARIAEQLIQTDPKYRGILEDRAALRYQQDAVPQADGYSGTLPEDVTWVGEIDGKRYRGLGKPKSGKPLTDHMPEGGH